ncbi:MAG: hypothetical protein IT162_06530 [Bryobacterales bacterium]|nr:hypothetical protein [Bryobacterales bacterium]
MKFSLPLFCAAALGAAALHAQDYFPLHPGNQWIYRTTFARTNSYLTVDILRHETIGGQTYSVVRGFNTNGQQALLRQTDDGRLIRYNPETRVEEVWAEFNTATGGTYRTALDECSQTARVESREAKASVPAAEFGGALQIRYQSDNCADAGRESEIYAPYIGLVERTSITIAGPRKTQLVYARVGGVTVLSAPEVAVTVGIDKTTYASGEPLELRLTLRNSSPAPLVLDFTSSQRYDAVIRDAAGKDVYQWSAVRSFLAVLGREEIAQGERNYVESIPLANLSGQALPAGQYTIEAWITAGPGAAGLTPPRYSGAVSFTIR